MLSCLSSSLFKIPCLAKWKLLTPSSSMVSIQQSIIDKLKGSLLLSKLLNPQYLKRPIEIYGHQGFMYCTLNKLMAIFHVME